MSQLEPISANEQIELHQLEERITWAFHEAGKALAEIRDKRLYRSNYATFEGYMEQRWGFSRRQGDRLIAAAEVVEDLVSSDERIRPIGLILPTKESQVRPLTSLSTEQRREAWQEAVETAPQGKVTATHVEMVAQRIRSQEAPVTRQANLVERLENAVQHFEGKQEAAKMPRVANDYYPTPENLIKPLLDRVNISGKILEPCAGHGAIAAHLPGCITNEPYPSRNFQPDFVMDAASPDFWEVVRKKRVDWVITNPPYEGESLIPIWRQSFATARTGIALLLRLNYLEPCENRRDWLAQYRQNLSHLIVFSPRPQFRADTPSSDNITVAWMVWSKQPTQGCTVDFVWDWR